MRPLRPILRVPLAIGFGFLIAATTAAGLAGSVDGFGRAVGQVLGREVGEPTPGRELVEIAEGPARLVGSTAPPTTPSPTSISAPDRSSEDARDVGVPDEARRDVSLGAGLVTDTDPADAEVASTTAPTTLAPATTAPTTSAPSSPPTTRAPATTAAPTTTRPPTTTTADASSGRTFTVSTDGRVAGSGVGIAAALASAQPGDTFAFAAGWHSALRLESVRGSAEAPVRIVAADPSSPPVFSSGNHAGGAGLELLGSQHIEIDRIAVRNSLWGIRIEASSGVLVRRADVSDIGQEGIRIVDRSNWITIANSVVSETGRRSGNAPDGTPYAKFGEGIYIGTGRGDSTDAVHHVTVRNTTITRTSAEAIDVKAPSHDITIANNTVSDINTRTSGAVVVHASEAYSASASTIAITGNTIRNVSSSSGHRDGVGIVVGSSAEIRGNTISDTAHYGIRVEDGGSGGASMSVTIADNTFRGIGIDAVWSATQRANVSLAGNDGL